ncbi:MAG: hypothetical protein V7L11_02135 [Nostoc sp.]
MPSLREASLSETLTRTPTVTAKPIIFIYQLSQAIAFRFTLL